MHYMYVHTNRMEDWVVAIVQGFDVAHDIFHWYFLVGRWLHR
jgi:hypothetical protein